MAPKLAYDLGAFMAGKQTKEELQGRVKELERENYRYKQTEKALSEELEK